MSSISVKRLVVIILIVFITSCTPIVGFFAGVPANYKGITQRELIKAAQKDYKLEVSEIILFDSLALDTFGRYPFKKRYDKSEVKPAIQFAMYDSSNMLVSNYATCEGSRKRLGVWETFPPKNINPLRDIKLTLDEEVERWRNVNGERINPAKFTSDYKLVVYWGTFSGTFGKRMVKQAKKYIQSHPDKDIQLILVNNDFIIAN